MLHAWTVKHQRLTPLPPEAPAQDALWIDLLDPDATESRAVTGLGADIPLPEAMRDLELSHRLHREENYDYLTLTLPVLPPGAEPGATLIAAPVTFILNKSRLITVRHHAPAAFSTWMTRADQLLDTPARPAQVFLGICEEVVADLADQLEFSGARLTTAARELYRQSERSHPAHLHGMLRRIGMESETISLLAAALVGMTRALRFFCHPEAGLTAADLTLHDEMLRDIQALETYAESLNSRLGMLTELTIGMIGLGDNQTTRTLSVVAAMFLPPTLISSIYGMNFEHMPGLKFEYGYPLTLLLMGGCSLLCLWLFRWRGWY